MPHREAYGTTDDLRRINLVNQRHQAGLCRTVLLDVVLQSFGSRWQLMGVYSDHYFNAAHFTPPWGAAYFNLADGDAGPCRNSFQENPSTGLKEFHIDGFRLDATQRYPGTILPRSHSRKCRGDSGIGRDCNLRGSEK